MRTDRWFLYALGAAVVWGLAYVISERAMKQYSLSAAFLLVAEGALALPLYGLLAHCTGSLHSDFAKVTNRWEVASVVASTALLVIFGNYLILMSVNLKNASLAGLVEISYPLFTALFSWLLFREVQLTWATGLGGALILSGVGIIYWKG